jgi:hypothetical protein
MDWSEFTAIATGVLALGLIPTAIGIWITYKAATDDLHATQQAAEAAQRASHDELEATREATQTARTMAQRQLEASYRPLLIGVVPTGPVSRNDPVLVAAPTQMEIEFPGGHSDTIDSRRTYVALSGGRINIAVPLRNVGNGLAVVFPALITVVGQRIGSMEGTSVQSKLVPPGETTRVVCAPRLTQLEAASYPWVVILTVPYQDFADGQQTIARVFLEQRYKESEWVLKDIDQLIGDNARDQMEEARARSVTPSGAAPIHESPAA